MKKLIIAFLAVALGFAAQAAVVDWSVSGTSATSGYTVLLLVGAPATSYDSVSDLKKAAISYAEIAKSGRVFTTGDQQASGETVTSSAKYYYAIISGDSATSFNYIEATDMGASVYTPPASGSAYTAKTAANILAGAAGTIGGPEPTPEPTSGLLLLLGVAGLALRRKQK